MFLFTVCLISDDHPSLVDQGISDSVDNSLRCLWAFVISLTCYVIYACKRKRVASTAASKVSKSGGRKSTFDADVLVERGVVNKAKHTGGDHQRIRKTSLLTESSTRLGDAYTDDPSIEPCGGGDTNGISVRERRLASIDANALNELVAPKSK
jgi:hypothetical protein